MARSRRQRLAAEPGSRSRDKDELLHEQEEEVQGGPKTAEAPDPEPIPSDRLLSEVHFNPQLTSEQRKILESVILKRAKAFSLDGRLGQHDAKVEIKLKKGQEEPVSMRPYAMSPLKRKIVDEQLDAWLAAKVIEESKSPWGSPVLLVFRNDKSRPGKWTSCKHYSGLITCLPSTLLPDSLNWR